jgi:hypothetical protein
MELLLAAHIGDAAEIKKKRVRKQKTDREDARLLLKLLLENRFPRIWVPSPENRDLRQRLWHRHRLVQMRTRIMNQLQKTMTLSADEFIRRFLLHVLPSGFHRIRYYGFLGNRHRKEKLEHCRQLLGMAPANENPSEPAPPEDYRDRYERLTGRSLRECPVCHRGRMIPINVLPEFHSSPAIKDTS